MENMQESEVRRKLRDAELEAKWHEHMRETLEIEAKTAFLNHESVLEALEKERETNKRLCESIRRTMEHCITNNMCHDGYNVDIHVAETVKTLRDDNKRLTSAMTSIIEALPKNKTGNALHEMMLGVLREKVGPFRPFPVPIVRPDKTFIV